MNSPANTDTWDHDGALKRVRGKEARVLSLVVLFLRDMPERMCKIESALEQSDLETVSSLAHAIKGVAGNLSGNVLTALAAELELEAEASNASSVNALWPKFHEEYKNLYAVLNQYHIEHAA